MLPHVSWLIDTGRVVKTKDGVDVAIWEFAWQEDEEALSQWATHFRSHYCSDCDIDDLRSGTGLSRRDYLLQMKFPKSGTDLGRSVRSGDFAEILVADYLEFKLNYWVPRTKYSAKDVTDESKKGCDILGFHVVTLGGASPADCLAVFEAKAGLSGTRPKLRLQAAIGGSAEDLLRKAETLNALKQRLRERREFQQARVVERFQNPTDNPYKEVFGGAALISADSVDAAVVEEITVSSHPRKEDLSLVVFHGKDLWSLVNELYRRAADEA